MTKIFSTPQELNAYIEINAYSIVYFEGGDGVGKTWLIDELCELDPDRYARYKTWDLENLDTNQPSYLNHLGADITDANVFVLDFLTQFLDQGGIEQTLLFDRSYLTSYIKNSKQSYEKLSWWAKTSGELLALVVLVISDDETVTSRLLRDLGDFNYRPTLSANRFFEARAKDLLGSLNDAHDLEWVIYRN